MKKILAILTLMTTSTAFAGAVTVEVMDIDNKTSASQKLYGLYVKENITKDLVGDVAFSNIVTSGTGTLSTRLETGLTGTTPRVGPVNGYVRVSVGQRFTNTKDYSYYGIEPGVLIPVGDFTGRVGYRYRSAFDPTANNDQTNTWRVGVSYAVTKKDTVGIRFDQVRGDASQNIWAFSYTRNF
jgi:hypothetical protein